MFVNDGGPFARALYETVPDDIELVVTRNPLGDRKTTLFADLLGTEDDGRRRCRACNGGARHNRQIPVHLRLDREIPRP